MATSSFDERVVVTDPKMIEKMRRDLDEIPAEFKDPKVAIPEQDVSENSRKWAMKFARSKR